MRCHDLQQSVLYRVLSAQPWAALSLLWKGGGRCRAGCRSYPRAGDGKAREVMKSNPFPPALSLPPLVSHTDLSQQESPMSCYCSASVWATCVCRTEEWQPAPAKPQGGERANPQP